MRYGEVIWEGNADDLRHRLLSEQHLVNNVRFQQQGPEDTT
jgi:hypothetical protein